MPLWALELKIDLTGLQKDALRWAHADGVRTGILFALFCFALVILWRKKA